MSKDTIILAVHLDISVATEVFVQYISGKYSKEVRGDNVYYRLKNQEWDIDSEPVINLREFIWELDEDQYAFIRFGEDADDIEIQGMIQEFGITVERTVKYA